MNYKEAIEVFTELLDAFDRDEHGDYFYDRGWEVCEAAILAHGALCTQPFWISVNDRLPADTEKVLVYTKTGNTTVARWIQRRGEFVASGNLTVTHWMPLPEPPKEEV